MLDLFGEAFQEITCFAQPEDDYLRNLLSSGTFVAMAAIDDAVVVGGLTGYFLPKPERRRSELYIYDLAVAASHRRRGVATNLIEAIRTLAAQRGVDAIFIQADIEDGAAIALYSRLGARKDVIHFDITPTS